MAKDHCGLSSCKPSPMVAAAAVAWIAAASYHHHRSAAVAFAGMGVLTAGEATTASLQHAVAGLANCASHER